MIENLLTLLTIALIVQTTDRRNYLGFLLLSYYAIFIIVDIDFFGFEVSSYLNNSLAIEWSMFMIFISLIYAALSALICGKGCRVCCLYSAYLIINTIVIFIESLDGSNAFIIDLIYTVTQNLNLFVDLSVVLLGTDNSFHNKDRKIGRIIYNTNNRINILCDKITNLLIGVKKT